MDQEFDEKKRALGLRVSFGLGSLFQAAQLSFCLLFSGHPTLFDAWAGLFAWDSVWFRHIAKNGYVSSIPPVQWQPEIANVAFLPGYPLTVKLVQVVTGLNLSASSLIASQIAAWGFWILLFIAMSRLTRRVELQIAAAALVFVHPAAFFLQAAYSESLFLLALIGLVLAAQAQMKSLVSRSSLVTGLAGLTLATTRIVGAPLVFIPVAIAVMQADLKRIGQLRRDMLMRVGASTFGLSGLGAFFAYCQAKWGMWNLYFETQRIGWGVQPNYAAIFDHTSWRLSSLSAALPTTIDPNRASAAMIPLYLWATLVFIGIELTWGRRRGDWRARAPWFVAAVLMMFINVSGLQSVEFKSFSRYSLPIHVCLLIAGLGWFGAPIRSAVGPDSMGSSARASMVRGAAVVLIVLVALYALAVQEHFLRLFTHMLWVA